ncbi:MAG: hypothetical protein ACLSG9_11165 [Eubacterium sp.]
MSKTYPGLDATALRPVISSSGCFRSITPRFISVSDDFDTVNFKGDTGGIDVAFKYLISECYSRDMSMKTKSAKYAKMRRGEYQSVICPYGYRKSADGRMEPDENVAGNVRLIFEWAAEGNTAAEITRKLYALHIPTPG